MASTSKKLTDLSLALGVVVFESKVVSEALLMLKPGARAGLSRHVATEALLLKSRSLADFLYPGRKDARDFHATDFPGEREKAPPDDIKRFREMVGSRCAHLSRKRLALELEPFEQYTGRKPGEWGRLLLDEAVQFVGRQREEGISFATDRHPRHYRALIRGYRSLTGTVLPPWPPSPVQP